MVAVDEFPFQNDMQLLWHAYCFILKKLDTYEY